MQNIIILLILIYKKFKFMCETKCLIFPKLDSKNIYIIIFIIASLFQKLIPKIVEKIENNNNENNKLPNSIINYFDIISNLFSDFLPVLIILKNKCLRENYNNRITTSEGEKTLQSMKRLFYIILPSIAFINFLAEFCLYIFYYINKSIDFNILIKQEDLFFVIFFDILFRYIFSRIFLNSYFYKHHYLSMLLNFLGFIPLLIISALNISEKKEKEKIFIYLFLCLLKIILLSLEDIFIKIALNKLLIRPYQLMLYKALFEVIPLIALSIHAIINEFSDIEYAFNNIVYFLIYRIIYIILGFFLNYSYITIIELINPNHLSILKSLEFIIIFFNNIIWIFIDKKNKEIKYINFIFEFISCFILLFGALIHNEMIVIKKCGFYECTDYYKTEVKGFSNIEIEFDIDKSVIKDNKEDNSLLDNSSFNYTGD
jgi:hypothetical protein